MIIIKNKAVNDVLSAPGRLLAKLLTRETKDAIRFSVQDADNLHEIIQPCDVLLVEGNQWVSGAIKYLTQSTWSHAAIYVGNIIAPEDSRQAPKVLIEADVKQGVIGVPLEKYTNFNTRICRPINLTDEDKATIVSYMMRHLGNDYDLKNVFDLARFLLPIPPIPGRFRRRMISMGSGDPTRAICSSLIAQAFQSVRYPIIPSTWPSDKNNAKTIFGIRHHSLFTPSDFDLSPYFEIVKPTLENDFEYQSLLWADSTAEFKLVSRPGIITPEKDR